MNEWLKGGKEKLLFFIKNYGRVSFFIFLIFLILSFSILIFLILKKDVLIVSFLDVGQGDSIYIKTPSNYEVLVDGGPGDIVLDRLHSEMSFFDKHIDMIISTHSDQDHITGFIPVLNNYQVEYILTSGKENDTQIFDEANLSFKKENASLETVRKGDIISFGDGVFMYILYPNSENIKYGDTNESSVCVLLTYGSSTVLLTGDLPESREAFLLDKNLPQNIIVYKAGHHGSKYSSSEKLLSYIKPKYSIISAGKNNKYGHPNEEAVVRLKKFSKQIFSTIDNGTITFIFDEKNVFIRTSK